MPSQVAHGNSKRRMSSWPWTWVSGHALSHAGPTSGQAQVSPVKASEASTILLSPAFPSALGDHPPSAPTWLTGRSAV